MAQWKTLAQKQVSTGMKQFIEVSLKQPPEGEGRFIGISKGWFVDKTGKKRYKSNIIIPCQQVGEVVSMLRSVEDNK